MADITPLALFPTMTSDATGINIPYADLAGLTQTEADISTGDGREIARILVETIATAINNLSAENRPTKMTATKANPVGVGTDTLRQSYTLTFDIAISQATAGLVGE